MAFGHVHLLLRICAVSICYPVDSNVRGPVVPQAVTYLVRPNAYTAERLAELRADAFKGGRDLSRAISVGAAAPGLPRRFGQVLQKSAVLYRA